jgi:hypothetical protein
MALMAEDEPLRDKFAFPAPARMDDRWELVERVCNSSHLRRSAKLRDLLLFLCHRWWSDGASEIREHEIGVEVFQRPADYDSTQDTLVRVQASQLRKRLERYFSEEGAAEPLVLEVAKGSYEPILREREPAPTPFLPPADPPAPPPPPKSSPAVPLLAAACLVLASLCVWLATRTPAGASRVDGPTLQRFWAAFAPSGEETTVVIADGAFSAIQDLLHRPIPLNEYVSRGYRAELDRPEHSREKKEFLAYLMERRYTSLADAMLLKRLWSTGVLDPARTSILYSRDIHLRTLQKGNHILVGSRRAVPWVDLFDDSLDFHFVYDESNRHVRVQNRRPGPGEPAVFDIPQNGDRAEERFSLVASLPNPARTGNVLILSGQEMSGTEAAANLMTTDRLLQEILARLPRSGPGVPHFEALLRVKHVEYTMQGYEILAVHPH